MQQYKVLFIDRDGTLIKEPADEQIDSLEKLELEPNVIPALLKLQQAGYRLVMVTNQDALGTSAFPQNDFEGAQNKLLQIFSGQGIEFSNVLICPHMPADNCDCRKPRVGLLLEYLQDKQLDFSRSAVIGDRESDMQLANNMKIDGILYGNTNDWLTIMDKLISKPRVAIVKRLTNETNIEVQVNLDKQSDININTGIGFFDHMLEQLAKHGGFSLNVKVAGDLQIDDHHTVEDTALALGQVLREALGDKIGIARYGFLLPMDESLAQVAIDLSGRPYSVFEAEFQRESVGELATELVPHFFRSLSEGLMAAINIKIEGQNTHHMIESVFKAMGRSLRMACRKQDNELPTTKGVL